MRVIRRTPLLLFAMALSLTAGCASDPPAADDRPGAPEQAPPAPEQAEADPKAEGADAPAAPQAQDPPDGDDTPGRQPPLGGGDARLGDYALEKSLEQQERVALAQNYFTTGQNLFRELRYREAAANLQRAVALDPSLTEAQQLLDRALWISGDGRAQRRDAVRVMVDERLAKIDQARVEMERLFNEGEMLMARERYETARERFERVLEAIRWFPYDIDRDGLRGKAEARIAEAKRLAGEQERRRLQMLQEAARQAAEHEAANARRFREATLRALLQDAREALRVGRYEKVERLAADILRQQPDHPEAADLRREARAEQHRETAVVNYRDRVEAWRRQMEWVETAAIPYQEIFQFPDREQWMEISRRDLPITELLARQQESQQDVIEINRRLESQQITLNFDRTPFNEAIDFLRDITGLNYVISTEAQELVDNETVEVSLRLRNISLNNALKLIVASNPSLRWRIESGVIKITTDEAATEELALEFYDVNEIVSTPPDYPAPELGLQLAGSGGGGGGAGGGVLSFDDAEETPGVGVDADTLIDLIERKLGEEDEDGSVEYSAGILIVRKSINAHRKVVKLLEALRSTTGISVTVEAKFVQVQDNLLEHIGIDVVNQPGLPPNAPPDTFGQINFPRGTNGGPQNVQVGYNYTDAQGQSNYRGAFVNALSSLAPAGLPFNISPNGGLSLQYNFLDDFQLQAILEAVRKTQKARLVNAPRLTVFNGQRSHILNIRQRAYIQDVEVNQTGVIPVLNPVIGILNTGSILEVRPTVSHDRRFVNLEVKPTLATELPARIPAPVQLAGGFTSIPIELPIITIQKLRSSVTVPDGGTVLLGGLKNYDEFEGESGVPFLMQIPLLQNLFRRQAFHKLRASLVVLLKADITIIRDEERRIFGRE